eukprot:493352_1
MRWCLLFAHAFESDDGPCGVISSSSLKSNTSLKYVTIQNSAILCATRTWNVDKNKTEEFARTEQDDCNLNDQNKLDSIISKQIAMVGIVCLNYIGVINTNWSIDRNAS